MRALVTSGGCREEIDGVRALVNYSTGATGASIADALVEKGADVTLLSGQGALAPQNASIRRVVFRKFADLQKSLEELVREERPDLVVHAAAVSDYGVGEVLVAEERLAPGEKIPSGAQEVVIRLLPHPKLINQIKKWHPTEGAPILIGFKLTVGASESEQAQAVSCLFRDSGADFIVANDLSQIRDGLHSTVIWKPGQGVLWRGETKRNLAQQLCNIVKKEYLWNSS